MLTASPLWLVPTLVLKSHYATGLVPKDAFHFPMGMVALMLMMSLRKEKQQGIRFY